MTKSNFLKLLKKVRQKGLYFSFLFWFFLAMSVLPLIAIVVYAVFFDKVTLLMSSVVLLAIMLGQVYARKLYSAALLSVLLNFALWFVMGLAAFTQNFFSWLPSYTAYILLAPYALISGGMVQQLLWRSSNSSKKMLLGAVLISTMIAIVAKLTSVVIEWSIRTAEQLVALEEITGGVTSIATKLLETTFYNPTTGFLMVLVLFNLPFIKHWLFNTHGKERYLFLYLIPIAIYFLMSFF